MQIFLLPVISYFTILIKRTSSWHLVWENYYDKSPDTENWFFMQLFHRCIMFNMGLVAFGLSVKNMQLYYRPTCVCANNIANQSPGAGTRKIRPTWILLKQDSEWQWHQLGHMQVCSSPAADLGFYKGGCPIHLKGAPPPSYFDPCYRNQTIFWP